MLNARHTVLLLLLTLGSALVNGATDPAGFINRADAILRQYVRSGGVDYAALHSSGAVQGLVKDIAALDLDTLEGDERKAVLINAYNLLVIDQALAYYPLKSVLNVPGFFDGLKHDVGGRQLTLNQLEKNLLLKKFKDSRLHFVLVCGADGCPPITDFAYTPAKLEAQLEMQTKAALNDPRFIRADASSVQLSQIFDWYKSDFGGSKRSAVDWINKYRDAPIPANAKVSFYSYDWSLNKPGAWEELDGAGAGDSGGVSTANNAARYVVSSTIPRGTAEVKVFNNLYSQEAAGERSSFFTTITSAIYGVSNRVNIGFDLRYRRVRYDDAASAGALDVLGSGGDFQRNVVATIGPKVRIAPLEQFPNLSIQSALWFPVADDLAGRDSDRRFVDFGGPTWFTQVFNDFPVGRKFSVFAELDFSLEDIGDGAEGHINRFSTPVTGIISYFPTPRATLYGLTSYAPYYRQGGDYFYQYGGGAKYQFTPKLEFELLVTSFEGQFIRSVSGSAATYNLGLRFNI